MKKEYNQSELLPDNLGLNISSISEIDQPYIQANIKEQKEDDCWV